MKIWNLPEDLARMRERVLADHCPYCDAGPFKMVGAHVCKAHGVRTEELKTLLRLPAHFGLASPETKQRKSEISKANWSKCADVALANLRPLPASINRGVRGYALPARRMKPETPERRRRREQRELRYARFAAGEIEREHGRASTYENYGCRCAACAAAHSERLAKGRGAA